MSTTFIPSTTVAILSGETTVDALGDEVDSDTVLATGLPAEWYERDQRTWEPVSGRATIVEGYRVRLRPGTTVTEGQRLRNERTGALGVITAVVADRNPLLATDVLVKLRKITR